MKDSPVSSQERLHALDGLRASMMLLGLVLHTLVSYTVANLGAAWPYRDNAQTVVADHVVTLIHVFRMPIFYVLAGFFAAMLFQRRGVGGLLRNRLGRIVLPLLLFLPLLYPLTRAGFTFTNIAKTADLAQAWAGTRAAASAASFYVPEGTLHLWFIYYLIYLYGAGLMVVALLTRLPASLRARLMRVTSDLLFGRPFTAVVVPALATALILLTMNGRLATRTGFMPSLSVLLAYGVFFAVGWLLYGQRHRLESLCAGAWWKTLAALALFLLVQFSSPALASTAAPLELIVRSLMGGLVAWLLFYGLTGLFLRYLNRPSGLVRWIVDASYWVYLVHLPIVIFVPGLLVQSGLGVWARIVITLASTTVLCFVSYWLFVRSSAIGALLNGRSAPRGLPALPTVLASR